MQSGPWQPNMVVEMTLLQGIMGQYYALKSGETPAVAEAIFEHYLPRSAETIVKTKPGLVGWTQGDRSDLDGF